MAICIKCRKEVGFLGAISFNKRTQRCSTCESATREALGRFRGAFLNFCRDDILTPQEWTSLQQGAASDQLDINEALAFLRGDALNLLQRTLTIAAVDGL